MNSKQRILIEKLFSNTLKLTNSIWAILESFDQILQIPSDKKIH